MNRMLTGFLAAGAFAIAGIGAVPSASATPVAPAYSCSIDTFSHVDVVDWLKVHTSPGLSTPAVGQLPNGAKFSYCSKVLKMADGRAWRYGYGYNGSVKLTGWVDADYLAGP